MLKMTNRLDRLLEEVVMAEFIVLILHFPESAEENHQKDLPEKKTGPLPPIET